ncbi:MAG: heavy-metal-associated domain-containing protein, partial [Clostridia bacterium]|nr:heavy-metal-associated domain-containing protein [Clostridia bacterium]
CNSACSLHKHNDIEIEERTMTKTMVIEGMMCMHCEARVRKTLEGIEGVASAVVSHENGTAVVTLSSDVSDETLKSAIVQQGYPVLEIK